MSSNKSKKILVVDDEVDILELLKYNLKKEGYNVKTVNNGIEAVETAKEFFPDLILLDIMMPNQDGVETCRQLRELPELENTFIIFLTARSESKVFRFDKSGKMLPPIGEKGQGPYEFIYPRTIS